MVSQVGTFIEGDPERDLPPELANRSGSGNDSLVNNKNMKAMSGAQQAQYPPPWMASTGQERSTDVFMLSDDVSRNRIWLNWRVFPLSSLAMLQLKFPELFRLTLY